MNRRQILQFAAGLPLLGIAGVQAADNPASATASRRYLLLVELNGGNDALNSVVPYADPLYARLRPNIGIARDQVVQLNEHSGLNPALQSLMPIWSAYQLAIVQGVGYPDPNRSHFRSIEIWDTGSDAEQYLDSGWLARALPGSSVTAGTIADGVVIGRNPQPMMGNNMRSLVVGDVQNFAARGKKLADVRQSTDNPALAHLLAVQDEVHAASAQLLDAAQHTPEPQADFPPTPFGRSLQQACRLIEMGRATPAIKVALGSFDTHSNQRNQQDRLLKEFADGMAAFRTATQKAGVWDQVLVLTYSEFGRRAAENGSNGTDHGTAAAHFLFGGAVKGGLYGQSPQLGALVDGDLALGQDYRGVYNTVLNRWWGLDQTPFDLKEHPPLALV
jgi:uncharacterized protein (DUF1501 family)